MLINNIKVINSAKFGAGEIEQIKSAIEDLKANNYEVYEVITYMRLIKGLVHYQTSLHADNSAWIEYKPSDQENDKLTLRRSLLAIGESDEYVDNLLLAIEDDSPYEYLVENPLAEMIYETYTHTRAEMIHQLTGYITKLQSVVNLLKTT